MGLPELVVDAAAEKRLRNGDSRALDSQVPPDGPLFKVISPHGELIAVARATSRVTAIVERIFNLGSSQTQHLNPFRFLSPGAGVTPAEGSVKPTAGFTYE